MVAPALNGAGYTPFSRFAQMPFLRVSTHQQGQAELCQMVDKVTTPCISAEFGRRQIRSFGVISRKAKPHWSKGELLQVIEGIGIHPQPITQTITRGIVKRFAGVMHPRARRLSGNQDARLRIQPDNGTWLMGCGRGRKAIGTKAAGLQAGNKLIHVTDLPKGCQNSKQVTFPR